MAGKKTIKVRYEAFHRAWTALTVSCLVIAFIASANAGASAATIAWRAGTVAVVLMFLSRIIIKCWASWEEMRRGTEKRK